MEADDTGNTGTNGVEHSSYDPTVDTTENQFWKNYAKEAKGYDDDFLLKNGSNIEGVLIFAGLFSAVSASFLVASQANLSPNPADTTNALLTILVDGNNSANQSLGIPVYNGPSSAVLASQILGYLALSASLLAALGAVLGKQWLSEFTQLRSGPLQEQGRRRQQKLDGLKRWQFEVFMGALPTLIQLALLLFSFSLIINLWELNRMVAGAVIATTAVGILLYLFVTLASLLSPTCPYRTPVSSTIHALIRGAIKSVEEIADQWGWNFGMRRLKPPPISRTNKILANIAAVSFSLFFIIASPILLVMLAISGPIFVCVTWLQGGRVLLQMRLDSYRSALQSKKLRLRVHKSLCSIRDSARNVLESIRKASLDPGPDSNSRSIAWLLETSTDPDCLMAAAELVPDTRWPDDLDISLPTEHLCSMFIRSIAEEDSFDERTLRLGKAFVIMLSRASNDISARFGRPALKRVIASINPEVDHDLRLIITIVAKLLSNSLRMESPVELPVALEVSQPLLSWLLQPLETLLQQDQSLRSSFLPEAHHVFCKLNWPKDSKLTGVDEAQYCQTFEAYFNTVTGPKLGQTDGTTSQSLEDKKPVERLKIILEKLKKLDPARPPGAYRHLNALLTVLSRLTSNSQFKQAIKDANLNSWMLAAFKEAVGKTDESGRDMWYFVSCLVQLAADVDAFSSVGGQTEKVGAGNGKTPSPSLRMDSASLLSYLLNKETPATPEHIEYALQIIHDNVDDHFALASNPHFVNYILYATGRQEYSIRDIGSKVLVATCQSLLRAYDPASLTMLATECDLACFLRRAILHQETMLQSIVEINDEVFKEKLVGILAPAHRDPFNELLTKLRDGSNKIPERDLRDLEIGLVLSNSEGRRRLLFDHLDRHISGQMPLWDTIALPLTVIIGWLLRPGGPVNSAEGIVTEVLRPDFEMLLIPAWGDPIVLEDNPQMLRLLLECTTRWLPIYVNSGTSETTLARLLQAVGQLRSRNRALSADIKRALEKLYREINLHSAETQI